MKKLALFAFIGLLSFSVTAQLETPQASPASKLKQTVGLTDVKVEYSRPSAKGRTIFGDLVPYGELWRTGANKNTTIWFSDDVKVDGQELKAGSYAIYTKPGKESWEVIFYSDTENWGTPRAWDDAKVAAKTTAKAYEMPMKVESFTISIDDLTNNGASIGLIWENTYVGVAFEVPTQATAKKSIDKFFGGPTANDYYAAASYYLEEGLDINKAKDWIDKAVSMNADAFWISRKQSLIYAKLGDTKKAIAAAKNSLAAAEKAGNADYVKMNKDSLKEWGIE